MKSLSAKQGHTKGPWSVGNGGADIRTQGSVLIATMHEHLPINGIDQKANAALIASAPTLLELLKETVKELRCTISMGGMETTIAESNNLDELAVRIDEAIQKAEAQ